MPHRLARWSKELYERLATLSSHWAKLGRSLERAVEAYNSAVGSLETRVLVSARKFVELESATFGVAMEPLDAVDIRPRELQNPDTATQL